MFRWLYPVACGLLFPFLLLGSALQTNPPGNTEGDDDDDDLDDAPAPASTGNSAADGLIRDYFERNRAWLKTQRRKLGRYRTRAVTAERELETVRSTSSQQPKATQEELDALAAYKALGTVEEVKSKIETGSTAVQQIATLQRDSLIRDAADAAGYNFDVLRDRVTDQELVIRDVDENGTKVKRAFIKPVNGSEKALSEYASEHWSPYLPALAANTNGESNSNDTQTQQQFPGQGPARQSNNQGQRSNVQVASSYARSVYTGPPKRGG